MNGVEHTAVALRRCLMCGGASHRSVFAENGVAIVRCDDCRHVFSSFTADPHYDGFWGDAVPEEEHRYWSADRAKMHEDFARAFLVGRAGRLVDMGCGLGFFLKGLSVYPDWEPHGCEVSPAAVRYATQTLGLRNVICTPLQDAELPRDAFDIVTMWDVLEHLARPDPLLARCHALLKEDGLCFIRTPNVAIQLPRARLARLVRGATEGPGYLQARDHLHHYSTTSIRRLLERNGFSRIQFLHLRPIQRRGVTGAAKTAWFPAVRALAFLTAGRINFDNLFVVGRKESSGVNGPLARSAQVQDVKCHAGNRTVREQAI
jgi:2-polyprenyl-3-methyl-5-hydroxy-6-metoxy-1,4-benzoquinol methylase